ncbi:MAG: helix-turn-helix domain-containing protein [Prevotella sp.]|nr:helix-turn-helix domain-containing protein [Prevotella sp.]
MAYVTTKDPPHHIELGSYSIDFNEGDVLLFDSVRDISPFFPLQPTTMLFAVCTSGRLELESEGKQLEFAANNLLLCPPKVRVASGRHSDDFNCKVLCLSEHLVRGLLRDKVDVWQQESYIRHLNVLPLTESCLDDFILYDNVISAKLKKTHPPTPHEIVLALLRAMLLDFYFRLHTGDSKHHEQRMSQGKVLFNRFLSIVSSSDVKRQPISVYAGQLAITPKYLTMLCLKYSNKTASEWVAQYTVEEIRYYLKNTELSIKEISALLGFTNMSHFGSYVRKHLGVSPSEYRYNKKH